MTTFQITRIGDIPHWQRSTPEVHKSLFWAEMYPQSAGVLINESTNILECKHNLFGGGHNQDHFEGSRKISAVDLAVCRTSAWWVITPGVWCSSLQARAWLLQLLSFYIKRFQVPWLVSSSSSLNHTEKPFTRLFWSTWPHSHRAIALNISLCEGVRPVSQINIVSTTKLQSSFRL